MIRVTFDGGTADTMPWKFRPTQSDVKVIAVACVFVFVCMFCLLSFDEFAADLLERAASNTTIGACSLLRKFPAPDNALC